MLKINLQNNELWDESSRTFIQINAVVLRLEHSLVSLSKWESIHQIPFLDGKQRTTEEIYSYIQCMCLDEIEEHVLLTLSKDDLQAIIAYIESKQTATTFRDQNAPRGRQEVITSELIYYWMVTYNIPFDAQSWHLNRLLTLIRICNVKAGKPKKMSRSELAAQTRALNEKRRRELGTTG